MDGVGGATAVAAEESVEVDGLGVGLLDWRSGVGRLQPFLGEEERDETVGAGDGQREGTCAEGGAVDEEEEIVGGVAAIRLRVEGDGEDVAVNAGRDDVHGWQRATTDDDAGEVYRAVGVDAVLVEVLEDGVGAVFLPHGLPMEPYEVGFLHVGREFGDHRKGIAVRLLCLGLRIGHMGGHGTFTLPPMPCVVYLVAEFAAHGGALFRCHSRCLFVY